MPLFHNQDMTIGEEARKWFEEQEPGSFTAALLRSFLFGGVISRPDFILLAEQVVSDGKQITAVLPGHEPNCWWVWYASVRPRGSFSPIDLQSEAPYSLPYVGFKRRGKIRIYEWEKLRRDFYALAEYIH